MVTIHEVRFSGLKGQEARAVTLGAATLLTGPVGSGKTAVADAVAFAFLGFVPRMGRSDSATARLMAGRELSVTVTLSDGRTLGRTLRRSGSKLQQEAHASWVPEGKATEVGDAIRALTGVDATEAAENLDVARLLDRSGADLARVVDALLAGAGLAPDARSERTADLWRQRIDSQREKIDGLLQPLAPATVDAMAVIEPTVRAQAASGLAGCVDWAGEQKRAAAAAIKQQRSAAEELRARAGEVAGPAQSAAALAAEIEEARDHQRAAEAALEHGEKSRAARDETAAAAMNWRSEAAHALDLLERAQAEAPAAEAARASVAAIIDPPMPTRRTVEMAWRARVVAARKAIVEADATLGDCRIPVAIDCTAAESAVAAAEREVKRLAAGPWHRVRKIAESLPDGCQAQRDELCRLAHEHGGSVLAAEAELTSALERMAEREAEADARSNDIVAGMALRSRLKDAQAAAIRERDEAERAEQAAVAAIDRDYRTAMAGYEEVVRGNAARGKGLLAEAERIERAIERAHAVHAEAAGKLREAEARLAGLAEASAVDVDGERAAIAHAEETIRDREDALARARQAESVQSETTLLLSRIANAEAAERCYAAAEWAAKRVRDEDLAAKASGLESRLRKFLGAAGRTEAPYLRTARGAAEFGWTRADGTDVSLPALSGGENVVYRAALSYAVLCARAPAIRVLAIEAAEAADGGDTAAAVLRACGKIAESGEVQVLAASCAPVEVRPMVDGWTVIECGARVAQEA